MNRSTVLFDPRSVMGQMIQAMKMQIRLSALSAAFVCLWPVSASHAQQAPADSVRAQYGSWALICDTPAGASSEQCALVQDAVSENRPEISLRVVVLRTADRKAEILRVLAPLQVLLPAGLGLVVDGKNVGNAPYVHCVPDGCYSEMILDDTLKGTLRNGAIATFTIFETPEEGIPVLVDLKSFGQGFDALP